MSELAHSLPEVCAHCGAPLEVSRYSFALSVNVMVLHPGADEDADPVPELKMLEWLPVGHYCSHDCCTSALPASLEAYGFAPSVKDQRIGNAVIQPCGYCGKPVNLTQPHRACQKNRYRWTDLDGDPAVEWLDVLAVQCANCEAFTEIRREIEALSESDSL